VLKYFLRKSKQRTGSISKLLGQDKFSRKKFASSAVVIGPRTARGLQRWNKGSASHSNFLRTQHFDIS